MKRDKEYTKVIFKKEYDRDLKEWSVIAFFPDGPANRGNVMSYAHMGQHGEAGYDYYLSCRHATKKEYMPLKKEMENLFGYRFKVVNRISKKDRERAWRRI